MAVQTGMMSGTQAAAHYGVPRTTIHTRLSYSKKEQPTYQFFSNTDDFIKTRKETIDIKRSPFHSSN